MNFCRWNHLEDYYVTDYNERIRVIYGNNIAVSIDIIDIDYSYITGHVVNEKNLIPAMKYLFLIWEIIASLRKRDFNKVAIVFEDVNFIRATVLSQRKVDLIVSIQKGNKIIKFFNQSVNFVTVRLSRCSKFAC